MVGTLAHVRDTGHRLVKNMRRVKLTWDVIRKVTERSPATLNAIINPSTTIAKTRGQPKKILKKILLVILKVTTRLQKKAKAEEEVSSCLFAWMEGAQRATSFVGSVIVRGWLLARVYDPSLLTQGVILVWDMVKEVFKDFCDIAWPSRGPYVARTGPGTGPGRGPLENCNGFVKIKNTN